MFSRKWLVRILKFIKKFLSWSYTKFSLLKFTRNCVAARGENWQSTTWHNLHHCCKWLHHILFMKQSWHAIPWQGTPRNIFKHHSIAILERKLCRNCNDQLQWTEKVTYNYNQLLFKVSWRKVDVILFTKQFTSSF